MRFVHAVAALASLQRRSAHLTSRDDSRRGLDSSVGIRYSF